ncbi:ABC transporter substrate-binding protein [Nibribacter ruber]|uniref:ABC transporter substrate-binding protein n=1 Tax=Nibribacter ruber TaxID=2698458 RepID=A0A6P1NTI6_9BACT|nr:helical backbone metal receptor [Nibribacter ruber]QHL87186.1 ABC transporter substrate-binding protein [Nibribacter ruber]
MGRLVEVPAYPQRIVSLVPSQTELLFELGLGDRVVGVTKFCIHPKELVKGKIKIGGTKNFKLDVIDQLQPDLIIGNKEENYQEGIEALQQKYPVWMSDIYTLEDALDMMDQIGKITQTEGKVQVLISSIKTQFEALQPIQPPVTATYFIWKNPYMAVGGHNFIDDVLTRCGFVNALHHLPRYPEVTPENLAALNPQVILLSSEPFPFQEKHVQEFQDICPSAKVLIVDGEMFSWYGSRLQQAVPYLQKVLQAVRAL